MLSSVEFQDSIYLSFDMISVLFMLKISVDGIFRICNNKSALKVYTQDKEVV